MAYKAKYTEQLVVRMSAEQREELDRIADREEVSVGQVVREALKLGVPARRPPQQ